MKGDKVSILCSGFGLGFYIPGLLLEKRFNENGVSADVAVFESLIPDDKKENVLRSKKSYHKNFSVALMSARIPIDIKQSLDPQLVEDLINIWGKEDRRRFILLSGHWLHVIDEYKARFPSKEIQADAMYIDCDLAPSWKSLKTVKPDYHSSVNEIWLYDYERREIRYQIPITEKPPIPFVERADRFLIHGGGWGMGTYQGKIPELEANGFQLDIVAYDVIETTVKKKGNRYFMVDPAWTAWKKNIHNRHEYPPFSEIKEGEAVVFSNKEEYHDLFDISREVKAIIGKPGAGTLIDSFGAATPLIMLEPFGEHERKSSELWKSVGFGISYDEWKTSGFDQKILKEMHNNILEKRKGCEDFIQYYKGKHNL